MAMSGLIEQLRDMMKCKVCLEEKEHQKQLHCQHTLCLECLDKLEVKDSKYRCPLCNQAFLVPNGGFETLPESLSTKQLASVISSNSTLAHLVSGQQMSADADSNGSPKENESVRQLEKEIEKSTEFIKLAETRIEKSVEMEKDMALEIDLMKATLHSLYDKAVADLKAAVETKTAAIEERASVWNEDISMKNSKMTEACRKARESMEQLKSKVAALKQSGENEDVSSDIQHSHVAVEILKDQIQGASSASGIFHEGDSVRLKLDMSQMNEKFLKRKIDHNSVGYILAVDSDDGDCAVAFADYGRWVGKTDMLEKSPTPHNLPVVGDRVKVRKTVAEPRFGWAGVTHQSVGLLKKIEGGASTEGRVVEVKFATKSDWKGIFEEMEKAPAEALKVGDEVWIAKNLDEPARGWAGVTRSSVGILLSVNGDQVTVQFPECERWQGLVTELERSRPVQAGDKVRVKKSVKTPKKGWGGMNHESEGIVMGIEKDSDLGEVAIVNFPTRLGLWKGALDELEIVDRQRGIGGKRTISIGLPGLGGLPTLGGGGGLAQALQEQHRQHMEQMEQCQTQ